MDSSFDFDVPSSNPEGYRPSGDAAPLKCWRCFLLNKSTALQCEFCDAPFDTSNLAPIAEEEIACWRCQKSNRVSLARCGYCDARLIQEEHHRERRENTQWKHGIVAMVGHYAVALLILLVGGWSLAFGVHRAGENDEAMFRKMLPILVTTDLLFLGLAVISYVHLAKECTQPPGRSALAAWLCAAPMLAIILGINYGYHWLLEQAFHVEGIKYPFWGSDLWPWTIALVCIQPAVAEEIFFRQVVLGTLRKHMSFHGAVWLSAMIFALAHLGGILSIPTLMLAGALFGYVRAATGSLVLPMLLHFTHNLVVVMFF